MEILDIKKVLHITTQPNLQLAAVDLSTTAGALSKVIKRVELKFKTKLFDREGKTLVVNQQGQKFKAIAAQLIHDYDQFEQSFLAKFDNPKVRVVGPSLLVDHWFLNRFEPIANRYELELKHLFEGDAVQSLMSGEADIAIVTADALSNLDQQLQADRLGETRFSIGLSPDIISPINLTTNGLDVSSNLPFATPLKSPFCGLVRGQGSDGWRDDLVPRNIQFKCDDYYSILRLVKRGVAVSYLPDYMIKEAGLNAVDPSDLPFENSEQIYLVWRPSFAEGWLNQLVPKLTSPL